MVTLSMEFLKSIGRLLAYLNIVVGLTAGNVLTAAVMVERGV